MGDLSWSAFYAGLSTKSWPNGCPPGTTAETMVRIQKHARRRRQPGSPSPSEPSATGFRLRHLLGLAVLVAATAWVWPRGQAAWRLHNQAVALADYSLCMVGPTGVEILRDRPEEFLPLLRRRLIQAMPEEKPFIDCAPLAEGLDLPYSSYRLLSFPAEDFLEYHNRPGLPKGASISRLRMDQRPFATLTERAWPFVRRGYGELMRPSSHADQAMHPPLPPQAGSGSGLPGRRTLYRSSAAFGDTFVVAMGSGANAQVLMSKDGGRHFGSGGRTLVRDLMDRCVADDEGRGYTLSRLGSGEQIVVSQGPGAAPQLSVLANADEEVAGIACDAFALVAAVALEADETGSRPMMLKECPFRRPCRNLTPPNVGSARLYFPLDVARMEGDTVVARSSGGITRVASSRDGGRSWTPWTVVYDAESEHRPGAAPFRLLAVGETLLLYTGGDGRYPLLISHDHGASFQSADVRRQEEQFPANTLAASPQLTR